jgi:CheY-like chemotaxis protein
MARILFLDDMSERQEAAREIAKKLDVEIYSAYDAEAAINRLENNLFSAASLDHDLAEEHYGRSYTESPPASGIEVARWIAEHSTPTLVMVHSWNPVGSTNMVNVLCDNPSLRVFKEIFSRPVFEQFLRIVLEEKR